HLQPDCAEAYSGLGLALQHKGAFKAAFAAYRMALRLRPAPQGAPGVPGLGPTLEVPSPRCGILLVVGTEVMEGEQVSPDCLVAAGGAGGIREPHDLREGTGDEPGNFPARRADRRAFAELAVKERTAAAALAALAAAREAHDAPQVEAKKAELETARAEVEQAQTI